MTAEKQLKYNEPWILQRADPYVYRHTDGTYYFTASVPNMTGLFLESRILWQGFLMRKRQKYGTGMKKDR